MYGIATGDAFAESGMVSYVCEACYPQFFLLDGVFFNWTNVWITHLTVQGTLRITAYVPCFIVEI